MSIVYKNKRKIVKDTYRGLPEHIPEPLWILADSKVTQPLPFTTYVDAHVLLLLLYFISSFAPQEVYVSFLLGADWIHPRSYPAFRTNQSSTTDLLSCAVPTCLFLIEELLYLTPPSASSTSLQMWPRYYWLSAPGLFSALDVTCPFATSTLAITFHV